MILPEPTATPLRGGPTLRWGVLAPGGIATDWVAAMHANTDQRVVAVASRSADRAAEFARKHGIGRSYGSYDQLVADPEVDIIYVAAPNIFHRPLALLAISAGKHVLIEKPLGIDAADARVIVDAARAAGVFAMEAMWTRFLPQTTIIAQLLAEGELGDLKVVTADFGANFGAPAGQPVFDPTMGGGSLRDIGIYPVWFSRFALGAPTAAFARGRMLDTGVDGQAAMILDHATGAQAVLHTTMQADTPTEARINGTRARVEVRTPFYAPNGFAVVRDDERTEFTDGTGLRGREGLSFQTTAIAQHIADGRTEAPEHPLDVSLEILETLDTMRAQIEAMG
ncbi:Gfo/Idh/MocA family oxidoreductase [Salinibacterium sp. NG22]|uniref:Gfo/Idh/MocA family protein n=1 Tax=Salinibacterium sp. NG22 TaxID=2792040 RepID=UPI0018CCFBD4|nr:Gfo/Idh/MocA family oxidoreductase [Salinibacterium sp. NG22]MBH0110143.1 Gfo/Idh/MocA family oxidoreductase [Salinibacterium sp. NG22]